MQLTLSSAVDMHLNNNTPDIKAEHLHAQSDLHMSYHWVMWQRLIKHLWIVTVELARVRESYESPLN